jgi:hypothetical protein
MRPFFPEIGSLPVRATAAHMAMTLRTGKGGRYRYCACSTKARQGETGRMGRTVPMEKPDRVVADHIEHRLLQPKRLEEILSSVHDRREERAERRTAHITELRKRAAVADAKLKRLSVGWMLSWRRTSCCPVLLIKSCEPRRNARTRSLSSRSEPTSAPTLSKVESVAALILERERRYSRRGSPAFRVLFPNR